MSRPMALIPGRFFHIFNRGNNRENLFREERNYVLFLRLYAYHVSPIAETFGYCLLKNHFHFLVRMRDLTGKRNRPRDLSKPFSNFFNAYSRTFNPSYGRTGALFQRPFGRILVEDDDYLARLIVYIHQNPQHHGLVKDFRDWPFSSFHVILANHPTFIDQGNVMKLFGERNHWDADHRRPSAGRKIEALAPDDFL